MGLRSLAKADNKSILNNIVSGFGWPISIKSPDGLTANLTGFSDDIAMVVDPDTGTPVTGRLISAVLHVQDILDAGLSIPIGISDGAKKPWLVEFDDSIGGHYVCKVRNSHPDRALGQVVLILELFDTNGLP